MKIKSPACNYCGMRGAVDAEVMEPQGEFGLWSDVTCRKLCPACIRSYDARPVRYIVGGEDRGAVVMAVYGYEGR